MTAMKIKEHAKKRAKTLSGGTKRKVSGYRSCVKHACTCIQGQ